MSSDALPRSPDLDDRRTDEEGELSFILGATSGGDAGAIGVGVTAFGSGPRESLNPRSRHISPGGCGAGGNPLSRNSGCADGSENEFVEGNAAAGGCAGGACAVTILAGGGAGGSTGAGGVG